MKNAEFASMGADQLKQEIVQLKKEFFNLKLNASTMHLKDYSQFKKLKKKIAQASTFLRQNELKK